MKEIEKKMITDFNAKKALKELGFNKGGNKMENEPKKLEKVKLDNITNSVLKELADIGIFNEQGLRVSGNGFIIKQLEKIKEEVTKINKQMYFVKKNLLDKLDKISEKIK